MRVLVTGASGFMGRHVVDALLRKSIKVRVSCRQGTNFMSDFDNGEVVYQSGLGTSADDWVDSVAQCSAVIHLAGRAHILRERHVDPVQAFKLANVEYARACGEASVIAGVQHFIFMSSVGVHGNENGTQRINSESDIKPHTQYAYSKAEAEQVLTEVVRDTCMKLTVIRPPLVYGSGAPGNFDILVRALKYSLPLPLGLVTNNRRSFVAIDNLVDLIVTCLNHPGSYNQTLMVSDDEDISTADLLRLLGSIMKKPARLIPAPINFLEIGAKLIGKQDIFQSLCGTLQVDISKTCSLLDWKPAVSLAEGLRRAVN